MFIHLHVHSEYSISDGTVRIKPLMQTLCELGMPAVALTDQSNLFAQVKFYKAALQAGIKPIIGADVLIQSDDIKTKPTHLTLLCQNQTGYHNLTVLIAKSYTDGQHSGRPVIDKSWLVGHTDGLIALSGGAQGEIGQYLLKNDHKAASTSLKQWQALFPDRFYLELQRCERQDDKAYDAAVLSLAVNAQCKVVATNAVRFLSADDYGAHEARVCIHDGYTLDDRNRPRLYSQAQYLKSPQVMCDLFHDVPSAIANTIVIAKQCNVQLDLGKSYLPDFPVPKEHTTASFLAASAMEKLQHKLSQLFPDPSQREQKAPIYQQRLQIEIDVINSMGFPGYFLIVADFISWAKDNGIPVGPGRGSGAGSLVAYVLGITDLDPIAHELLFERFLNPERVSMPDFDIDFCMDGRDRVIDYVAKRYGRESVSQIITFGTMAAKAVVRDVGRVLGHPYGFVDKLAKLIPFELGITLKKALSQEALLRERYEQEDDVRTLIDLALKLEGLTRNAGKHAGGVVIAPGKLTDFTALYCEASGDNLVTQFDKDDVEAVGLVKFDFLGLRTLTIIDWALRTINQQRQAQDLAPIDINQIDMADAQSFDLLKRCETSAVFQLESRGMKELVKRLQPDCFDDIVALVALFRPGPLQSGMVDDFIDRKHGRAEVAYPHPELAPILKPTYGVVLYQEQVMQIAQVLANYSLGGADILRRAMGKKKPEEMAKQREIFLQGATARGVDEALAGSIFDLMEKFAGYGFNKSHSAAYALVAYQTAWLKSHYPAAFMAAVLSSDMDNTDKVVNLLEECQRMQLTVLPPSINQGVYPFTVNANNEVIYGLGAIKGVGQAVVDMIVAERERAGEFHDLFQFCRRFDQRKVNKRVLEALIKSGSMDDFAMSRASLLASIERALQAAQQQQKNSESGQVDLFASMGDDSEAVSADYVTVAPLSLEQKLQGEKESLGWYLSGHPLDPYRDEIRHIASTSLAKVRPQANKTIVVAGLITAIRTLNTKRGDRMAIVTIDDHSGRLDITLFSEAYQLYRPLLQKDTIIFAEGEVSLDDFTGGSRMMGQRLFDLSAAREQYAKHIELCVKQTQLNPEFIKRLQAILTTYQPGSCQVALRYQNQQAEAIAGLGQQWQVCPSQALLGELQQYLGAESVSVLYR